MSIGGKKPGIWPTPKSRGASVQTQSPSQLHCGSQFYLRDDSLWRLLGLQELRQGVSSGFQHGQVRGLEDTLGSNWVLVPQISCDFLPLHRTEVGDSFPEQAGMRRVAQSGKQK